MCVCVHKYKYREERSENFLSERAGDIRGREDLTVQCRGEGSFSRPARGNIRQTISFGALKGRERGHTAALSQGSDGGMTETGQKFSVTSG